MSLAFLRGALLLPLAFALRLFQEKSKPRAKRKPDDNGMTEEEAIAEQVR